MGHAASCCPVFVFVQQFFKTPTRVSDATLVVYDFYPFMIVPVIGTAAIVSVFIIYALTAYFREHHGPETGDKK